MNAKIPYHFSKILLFAFTNIPADAAFGRLYASAIKAEAYFQQQHLVVGFKIYDGFFSVQRRIHLFDPVVPDAKRDGRDIRQHDG